MLALMEHIVYQDPTGPNEGSQIPADHLDATFARRLREVRERAGITQQELADVMTRGGTKMHRSTIGKIEAGVRVVSVGEAAQLAGALGVWIEELLGDPRRAGERERKYAAFVEARVRVRVLRNEYAERRRLLDEAEVLCLNTEDRLKAAQERLARAAVAAGHGTPELAEELTAREIEQSLAATMRPLVTPKGDGQQ